MALPLHMNVTTSIREVPIRSDQIKVAFRADGRRWALVSAEQRTFTYEMVSQPGSAQAGRAADDRGLAIQASPPYHA